MCDGRKKTHFFGLRVTWWWSSASVSHTDWRTTNIASHTHPHSHTFYFIIIRRAFYAPRAHGSLVRMLNFSISPSGPAPIVVYVYIVWVLRRSNENHLNKTWSSDLFFRSFIPYSQIISFRRLSQFAPSKKKRSGKHLPFVTNVKNKTKTRMKERSWKALWRNLET